MSTSDEYHSSLLSEEQEPLDNIRQRLFDRDPSVINAGVPPTLLSELSCIHTPPPLKPLDHTNVPLPVARRCDLSYFNDLSAIDEAEDDDLSYDIDWEEECRLIMDCCMEVMHITTILHRKINNKKELQLVKKKLSYKEN